MSFANSVVLSYHLQVNMGEYLAQFAQSNSVESGTKRRRKTQGGDSKRQRTQCKICSKVVYDSETCCE